MSQRDQEKTNSAEKICPECNGKKIIAGVCTCDMEWRGTEKNGGAWEDCQCTPDVTCQRCNGTGYISG